MIKECIDGNITNTSAARRLNLKVRQVQRLKLRYRENQEDGLKHGNVGNKNHSSIEEDTDSIILKRYEQLKQANINFAHFHKVLEREGIKVSYKHVYNLLTNQSYKSPRKHRAIKIHKRRLNRKHFGELLQTDGSKHKWLINNQNYYTLHGFIDDATGNCLWFVYE